MVATGTDVNAIATIQALEIRTGQSGLANAMRVTHQRVENVEINSRGGDDRLAVRTVHTRTTFNTGAATTRSTSAATPRWAGSGSRIQHGRQRQLHQRAGDRERPGAGDQPLRLYDTATARRTTPPSLPRASPTAWSTAGAAHGGRAFMAPAAASPTPRWRSSTSASATARAATCSPSRARTATSRLSPSSSGNGADVSTSRPGRDLALATGEAATRCGSAARRANVGHSTACWTPSRHGQRDRGPASRSRRHRQRRHPQGLDPATSSARTPSDRLGIIGMGMTLASATPASTC